jgi:hypothetical protein
VRHEPGAVSDHGIEIASLDNVEGLNQGGGFNNPQLPPLRAQVRFNAHH